jgi:hypothetical protein
VADKPHRIQRPELQAAEGARQERVHQADIMQGLDDGCGEKSAFVIARCVLVEEIMQGLRHAKGIFRRRGLDADTGGIRRSHRTLLNLAFLPLLKLKLRIDSDPGQAPSMASLMTIGPL